MISMILSWGWVIRMINPKPISFKPSAGDQAIIDSLLATGKFSSNADIIRNACLVLASVTLSPEEYQATLATAYELGVSQRVK